MFHVGTFAVPTYGFMLATGLFLGLLYGTVQLRRDGQNPEWGWDLGILAMIGAVVGGRGEYVRTHYERFLEKPAEMFALRDGGMVFYGGLVVSIAMYLVYARWRKVPALALFDAMSPSVAFGHAIGRFGCLGAGCCYGQATDSAWAITFPPGAVAPAGIARVPTQVHEILFNAALGLLLVFMPRRFVGQRFVLLLTLYPVFRSINELFRGDEERGRLFGTAITNGEATSALLVLVAIAIAVYASRRYPLSPGGVEVQKG